MERVEEQIPALRERAGITLTADSPEYRALCEWGQDGNWTSRYANDHDVTPTRLNLAIAEALLKILQLATTTGQHDQSDWGHSRESCGTTCCGGGWLIFLADLCDWSGDAPYARVLEAKRYSGGPIKAPYDARPPLRALAGYLLGVNGHDAYYLFYRATEVQFIAELTRRILEEKSLQMHEAASEA